MECLAPPWVGTKHSTPRFGDCLTCPRAAQLMFMKVFLETERLVLRWFDPEDFDLLVELDGDPEVMRYINNGQPVDQAEIADYFDWWLTHYDRNGGYGFFAAIEKATDRFLGWFHFRPGEGAGPLEPELGYRLRRDAWGQGYATEGSQALVDKGFADLGIERVNAETMAVNIGSRRVMENVGLRFVRNFRAEWPVRIPGDEEGDVEYAITRAEWETGRGG